MRLDLDLVREILQDIEEKETVNGYEGTPEIAGYTDDGIAYHVRLMAKEGLITYRPYMGGYFIGGMEWSGHEFLSASRSSKIWKKTKDVFVEKGVGITIGLATAYMKKLASDHLGI